VCDDAVNAMYHDDRVLRAFVVVTDTAPPRFVERPAR
jgi:hypothetical protein